MTLTEIEQRLSVLWQYARDLHQEIDALTAEAARLRARGERAAPTPARFLTRETWRERHPYGRPLRAALGSHCLSGRTGGDRQPCLWFVPLEALGERLEVKNRRMRSRLLLEPSSPPVWQRGRYGAQVLG